MGTYTTNNWFYKPDIGAYGATELSRYNAALEAVDAKLQLLENAYHYITPEDYGAVGDGVTDDTKAVQDAFDAAYVAQATWTIELQYFSVVPVLFRKMYKCTDNIQIKGHCAMMGPFAPPHATRPLVYLDPLVTTKHLFTLVDPGEGCSLTVANMSFAGSGALNYIFYMPETYDGSTQVCNSIYFLNNWFGACGNCIYGEKIYDLMFFGNTIDGPVLGVGLRFEKIEELRVINNHFYSIPYGVMSEDYMIGTITANVWRNNANGACIALLNGLSIPGGSTGTTALSLAANTMNGLSPIPNNQVGIKIDGAGPCNITSNGTIYNNLDAGYYDIHTGTATVRSHGEVFGANVTARILQPLGLTATCYTGDIWPAAGTTAQRPNLVAGNESQWYYDATVTRNVYWDGTTWKDELVTNGNSHDHSGGDGAQISHAGLSNLTSGDPHTQYGLLAGRAGGQTQYGGTASGDDLYLRSTSHATKGDVLLNDLGGRVIGYKSMLTEYGGFAVLLTAGEDLYEGEVVYHPGAANLTVVKNPIDGDMPLGVVYADAANGASVWVVVSGIAYVLPEAAVTAARGYIIYSSDATAGRVDQAIALPAVAFHNRECGHFLETGPGNGVKARAIIHFN